MFYSQEVLSIRVRNLIGKNRPFPIGNRISDPWLHHHTLLVTRVVPATTFCRALPLQHHLLHNVKVLDETGGHTVLGYSHRGAHFILFDRSTAAHHGAASKTTQEGWHSTVYSAKSGQEA